MLKLGHRSTDGHLSSSAFLTSSSGIRLSMTFLCLSVLGGGQTYVGPKYFRVRCCSPITGVRDVLGGRTLYCNGGVGEATKDHQFLKGNDNNC